jgi:hypothetical protein
MPVNPGGMMSENNLLVKVDDGWVWADNELAAKARKEFEAAVFALGGEDTSKVLSGMLVEAIGAGAQGEGFQELMIGVITGAIAKIQEDGRKSWEFVYENAGLDGEVDLSYNWPKGLFYLNEPAAEEA